MFTLNFFFGGTKTCSIMKHFQNTNQVTLLCHNLFCRCNTAFVITGCFWHYKILLGNDHGMPKKIVYYVAQYLLICFTVNAHTYIFSPFIFISKFCYFLLSSPGMKQLFFIRMRCFCSLQQT